MQMAGHTLSVMETNRISSILAKPSISQSRMSFAALFERTIIVIASSSLRAPDHSGARSRGGVRKDQNLNPCSPVRRTCCRRENVPYGDIRETNEAPQLEGPTVLRSRTANSPTVIGSDPSQCLPFAVTKGV